MTTDEQLALWVNGQPVHNTERDECCPDFSCCTPWMLAPLEQRIAFRDGTDSERDAMLMGFLGKALSAEGYKVTTSEDVRKEVDGEEWKDA